MLTRSCSSVHRADICREDWLEMYNMYHDGTETLIGRYCSTTAPGPIDSNRGAVGLKVVLRSDDEGVFSGFKAHYSFEPVKPIYGRRSESGSAASTPVASASALFRGAAVTYGTTLCLSGSCGGNISKAFGVIQSPNYPLNYDGPKENGSKVCNWYLSVRPRHRILLNFEAFAVEGEPSGT